MGEQYQEEYHGVAHIDNLIEKIDDPELRARIAEQVALLVKRKDFGLVFQDHLPEDIEVPGVRPRRGDSVRMRGHGMRPDLLVLKTLNGIATVVEKTAGGAVVEGAQATDCPFDQLVVIKDFSLPIYPGLKKIGAINRGDDKPTHVVVQGENYYALETLLYTHEQGIDLIYVDPPYNTGAAEWIYNDRYIDANDGYRHSKWLAFMKRRLEHAKRLLKPTGVVVVAIDDNEHHRLRMLLDQVFGEDNFLANVTWQGSVKSNARFTGAGADYMLIYARNRAELVRSDARWLEEKAGVRYVLAAGDDAWERSGGDPDAATALFRAWWKLNTRSVDPGLREYNRIDERGRVFRRGDMGVNEARPNRSRYVLNHPVTGDPLPTPKNGWDCSTETLLRRLESGDIFFGVEAGAIPAMKRYLADLDTQVPKPSFEAKRSDSSKHLETVLGEKRFPFPKDHNILMRWFSMIAPKDAVILDFFAGSGSSAEAVMRLNAQDGGRRQSIIITNNELAERAAKRLIKEGHLPGDPLWEAEGVFQNVTWPRIETVVHGTRRDGSRFSDGLNENVAFFQLTYEDEDLIALGRKFDAIAPLLWLKAGATGQIIEHIDPQGWALPENGRYGVLFDVARSREFADAVHAAGQRVRHMFVVSDSEAAFQTALSLISTEHRVESTRLYSDYLRSFEINGKD